MKKIVSIAMLAIMCFTLIVGNLAYAEPPPSEKDTTITTSSTSTAPEESKDTGIIASIKELVHNLKEFTTGGLTKLIDGMLISIMDGLLTPLVNLWSKYLISTPLLGPVGFVHKNWNMSLFIAFPLFGLALIPAAWRIWSPQRNGTGLFAPLKTLMTSLVGCFFGLYLVDFIITVKNVVSKALAQSVLTDYAARLDGGNAISLEQLSGTMMIKAAIISKPEVMDAAVTIGKAVYDELGLFYCVVVIFVLTIDSIFLLLSWLLLLLLTTASPLYFAYTGLTNRIESLAGWVNLTLRSIFVSVIFLFGWAWSVGSFDNSSFSSDIGVSPTLFALMLMAIATVVCYKFWFKQAYRASITPLTLNGGAVIDNLGKSTLAFGTFARGVVNRFDLGATQAGLMVGGMEKFGAKAREYGAKITDYGKEHGYGTAAEFNKETSKVFDNKGSLNLRRDIADLTTSVFGKQKGLTPYWEDGHEYVTLVHGMPVRNPSPPKDGLYQGKWSSRSGKK